MAQFSPDDHSKPPSTSAERWILTLFAAGFIGIMGAELASEFNPRKLSVIFLLLSWVPLLAIHEAGHAIVARLCGWHVERVVIGFGRTLKRLDIAGTPVLFKAFPLSGYVLPRAGNMHSPRLKSTLIYAGGPAFEAIIALAVIHAVGPEHIFHLSDSIPLIAAQSFCIAAAIGLFVTLVPHTTGTGGGESWSDGMGILLSWRLPDEYFRSQMTASPPDIPA